MPAPPEPSRTEQESEQRRSPSSRIVHDAILKEGLEELDRPTSALAWSAIAGGLSMGFSLVTESALHALLPDTSWRPLIAKLGYSVGFLIVILGRQQLFTENTLTPILPWLDRPRQVPASSVLRLWLTVLAGNLAGAVGIALTLSRTAVLPPDMRAAMLSIAHETLDAGFGLVVLRGIFAGWLIALLVWLLPAAETARVWVVVIITYVIGLGHFSHVIAGAIDVFAAAGAGQASWGGVLGGFVVPALTGNILGGVTLVAFLNHAQVRSGETGDTPGR